MIGLKIRFHKKSKLKCKVVSYRNALLVLFVFILPLLFLLTGCMPGLVVSEASWYTETELSGNLLFGFVHLSLKGQAIADRVTVVTYGDGLIEEYELELVADGTFSDDIVIRFTHSADNTPRTYSTVVTAYHNEKKITILLESEPLQYMP